MKKFWKKKDREKLNDDAGELTKSACQISLPENF